ncbi:MAG: hypothetical protein K6F91_04450 [Ruminococcus sp.]|nr:hypothetical protein [Ruminococcus sp.]
MNNAYNTDLYQNDIESLDGDFPRYLLEPFEVVRPDDPRYDSALTRQQLIDIEKKTAQQ